LTFGFRRTQSILVNFSSALLLWFVANLQFQDSRGPNLGPVVEMQTPTMRSSTRKNAT